MNKYQERIFRLGKKTGARLVMPETHDKRIQEASHELELMGFQVLKHEDLKENNKDLEQKILQNIIDARNEFNIGTTPSFLINGTLIEGNKPFKNFKKIIDNILKNIE